MNPTTRQRDRILKIFEGSGLDQEGLETLLESSELGELVSRYLGSGLQPDVYPLEVDDRVPMGSLIKSGEYNFVASMIQTLKDRHELLGSRKLRLRRLKTVKEMKPEEVSHLIAKRKLESARLPELLHFGKMHPQLNDPLLALGSLTLVNGINWIPMIIGREGGYELSTWEFLPGLRLPPTSFLVYETEP